MAIAGCRSAYLYDRSSMSIAKPRPEGILHTEIVWPVAALLGEGPVWVREEQALWFVDIKGNALHRYVPAQDDRTTFAVDGQPSFVVPTTAGTLLVGAGRDLRYFDSGLLGGSVATLDMPGGNRTNDATVDRHGRLWFGTMDDGEREPSGAVYVFDGRAIRKVGGDCVITNGPAISPDGKWLYHVDTLKRLIWRFDIRSGDALGNGDVLVSIAPEDGSPDGISVDAEGCLWVGLWGGWEARRYAPDGALMARIAFPCANVTKIAFGGPDLRTAYATTARGCLDRNALAEQPLAGGLFSFEAPVPGLPCPKFRAAA
jgi:D-xylonolactonase